jgi:hypothetical protein
MTAWTHPILHRVRSHSTEQPAPESATREICCAVQLVALKCVASAGLDGDLIGLKFNGQPIWSSGSVRMSAFPSHEGQVRQFPLMGIILFDDLIASSQFELCERRGLLGSRRLGAAPVSASDVGREITAVFDSGSARYTLTYRVSKR